MGSSNIYNFYVFFPGGYRVSDINNDNTDIYVMFKDDFSKVFFSSLFTLNNIRELMTENKQPFFWSDKMLIVEDLSRDMIYKSINEIIETDYLIFDEIFELIGNHFEVFESNEILENLC